MSDLTSVLQFRVIGDFQGQSYSKQKSYVCLIDQELWGVIDVIRGLFLVGVSRCRKL